MNDLQLVPSCSDPQLVKIKFISVVRDPKTDTPIVILREVQGECGDALYLTRVEDNAMSEVPSENSPVIVTNEENPHWNLQLKRRLCPPQNGNWPPAKG